MWLQYVVKVGEKNKLSEITSWDFMFKFVHTNIRCGPLQACLQMWLPSDWANWGKETSKNSGLQGYSTEQTLYARTHQCGYTLGRYPMHTCMVNTHWTKQNPPNEEHFLNLLYTYEIGQWRASIYKIKNKQMENCCFMWDCKLLQISSCIYHQVFD